MDHGGARRRGHDLLRGVSRDRALPDRDGQLPQQPRHGPTHALGCAAANRCRAALRSLCGDGRSRRRRSLDRGGQRSRRCGADAGACACGDRRFRRRASCRAAIPQTRARPRRSRGAGAARTRAEGPRMSEPENFIARWARRKRNAAEEPKVAPSTDPGEESREGSGPAPVASGAPESAEAVLDLTKLPPIEMITAETDIRAFLAPGVPAELTRAALRRAWAADPKIRDFIGLSENSWDFNAPGGVPGFGSLEMTDELRQQIARMVGRSLANAPTDSPAQTSAEVQGEPSPAETSTESVATAGGVAAQDVQSNAGRSQNERIGAQNEPHNSAALPQRSKVDIASRNNSENTDNDQLIGKRPHGRALPK